MQPDLEPLLALSRSSDTVQTASQLRTLAALAPDLPSAEVYNSISIAVGRHFLDGRISFDDADWIINNVYGLMVEEAAGHGDGFTFAEPAFSIYEAFDAGEWNRGDGSDPVERYTKPLLRTISPAGRRE